MFENKLRDMLNRKAEPAGAPSAIISSGRMSAEERGMQQKQIDELKYISHLLERLCWLAAPGKMEFTEYAKMLKENYYAGDEQGAA